jgi:hypothetical protein
MRSSQEDTNTSAFSKLEKPTQAERSTQADRSTRLESIRRGEILKSTTDTNKTYFSKFTVTNAVPNSSRNYITPYKTVNESRVFESESKSL